VEELLKGACLIDGGEVEIDQDVLVVVERPIDPCRQRGRVGPRATEAVEGSAPGGEVGDPVLDVQGCTMNSRTSARTAASSHFTGVSKSCIPSGPASPDAP